ncbi:MAG TPA: hypothetical protein VHL78_03280 [Actinomycetota bacterium]|nr:hypothetical protein [Actinomycetota bacterium]
MVRVSIGRIEVRAVAPAEPAAKPQPAASGPELGLGEFLRRYGNRAGERG